MELLKKHTLYIGLLDQNSRKQEVSTEYAKNFIAKVIGDCTISNATGYYTHVIDKTRITENSLRVEVLFKTDAEIYDACQVIKKHLNQETIGVCVSSEMSGLV